MCLQSNPRIQAVLRPRQAEPSMPITRKIPALRPSLALVLLGVLLATLWLAGGATRGNVAGQVFVRSVAFLALIVHILFGQRPAMTSAKPVWLFLGAAVLIAIVQLLPLPTELWQSLPGREIVDTVPVARSQHSWSLVPGRSVNALIALVVPLTVLVLLTALTKDEQMWVPSLILALEVASMLVGLLQFSGVSINDPFVNSTPGSVSGTFANHNHFALFLTLGCLVVPVWVFREGRQLVWRGLGGLGLLLLFVLVILASGSRAGMMIGALAIIIVGILSWRDLRRGLRRAPRWVIPTIVVTTIAVLGSFVFASVAMNRAVSVQRIVSLNVEQDMRSRAFPTVWQMTRDAFPAGIGLGGFDAAFRAREPFELLKPTYFNQAHNDLLEVVLDAGLPGLLLLSAALVWWAWASIKAWCDVATRGALLPRLGSAMLLLIVIASVIDYPARTPLIMAMIIIAAIWLSRHSDGDARSALPNPELHL